MIESPIRRKCTNYPKDFFPTRTPVPPQTLRYAVTDPKHTELHCSKCLSEL